MKKNKFIKITFSKQKNFANKVKKIKQEKNQIIIKTNSFFADLFTLLNFQEIIDNNFNFLLTSYDGFLISQKPHNYENCLQTNQGMYYDFMIKDNQFISKISNCSCFVNKYGDKKSLDVMKHFFGKQWNKVTIEQIKNCDETRSKLIAYFKKYISNYPKKVKTLYLIGNKGVGKSFLLAAFANSLLAKEKNIIAIDTLKFFVEFLANKSEVFIKSQKQILKECKILFIENLGNEPINSFTRDFILGDIINYRFKNKKPIFFSSKFNFLQLEKRYSKNNSSINAKQIINQIRSFSIPIIIEKCF